MNTHNHDATIELLKVRFDSLGYEINSFRLSDLPMTSFKAPNGNVWLTHNNRINYPFANSTARIVSTRKDVAYELAANLNVSIPKTLVIAVKDYHDEMLRPMLERVPLIVKPNVASLSHGLTLNIKTVEGLKAAIHKAGAFWDTVLVQQQVNGEELRFVVLNGQVKAILMRQSPQVIGDGMSTVGELIAHENELRAELTFDYLTYPLLGEDLLIIKPAKLADVPAKGAVVKLGRGTMIATGASIFNIFDETHQSYIEIAERLANALGYGFVVVDMFVLDHKVPLSPDNYSFIEYNMSPVLKLFYSCRDGKHYDVLSDLVPLIDQVIQKGYKHE